MLFLIRVLNYHLFGKAYFRFTVSFVNVFQFGCVLLSLLVLRVGCD